MNKSRIELDRPNVNTNIVCFKDGVWETNSVEQQFEMSFSPFNAHGWVYKLVCDSLPKVKGLIRQKNRQLFAMELVDKMLADSRFSEKIINGFIKSEIFIPK